MRDLRLVPIVAIVWGAALSALLVPTQAWTIALGLWAAVPLTAAPLIVRAMRARRSTRAAVVSDLALPVARARHARRWRSTAAALAIAAGALGAAAASHVALAEPARAAASALAIDGGRAIEVHAVVVGKVQPDATGTLRLDAQADRIDRGRDRHAVDIPVSIAVAPRDVSGSRFDVGSTITASGTAFRADAGERAVLVVRASRGVRVEEPPQGLLATASDLRRGLVASARGLPQPGAGLMPGLAVGDTSTVDPELAAAMKMTSLTHLTAVSGANCALVVGIAFAVAALCGARRGVRVAAGLAALALFVGIVTPEPSVVRAAVMAAIAMLGVLLGRTGAGVSLLATAIVVALVADPHLALSLGFALSAGATGALLILARPLARGLSRWMPRALALALAVPLSAELVCGPLLMTINPAVPLYGIVANLLADPAAGPATILGLAACLAAPVPPLQSGLAALAWIPAAWIAGTAETVASLPARLVPWLPGLAGVAAFGTVSIAVALVVIRPARVRRAVVPAAALLAAVVGIVSGIGISQTAVAGVSVPSAWAVGACDVGQGDALLVRSAGRTALIDTGPDPAPVAACLAKLGIDRVDLLVVTHYDKDHAGGLEAVAGRVDTVLHGPPATAANQRVLDRLERTGAHVVAASAGMSGSLGAAMWTVLWPPPRSKAFTSGNQACVVLDVRGGEVPPSIFLCDTDAVAQRALLSSRAVLPPYAVVKVAHHGSADQEKALYAALRGPVALISVGAGNDYGHPRAPTLAFLMALGARIHRTDQEGMLLVSVTDGGVRVWHERAPPSGAGAPTPGR
ncbi:ComEC/Rec2 family competence protein [Microbacterium sp. ASV49]|uniref:ComEC/Rec2 family competence protein n=1 Tax=Microbacterium candidum TaxID=3041922 RepID=A0ABT7MYY6_9MICO|nr:ComEC/Rec2 family competence protein [Microbacterium sp. ASV49]MDL9979637.1 ComEC/Rec2 family competence protein [Microbacterium sp. ASV49]